MTQKKKLKKKIKVKKRIKTIKALNYFVSDKTGVEIYTLYKNSNFEINGFMFNGIENLKQSLSHVYTDSIYTHLNIYVHTGGAVVVRISEKYPCFDSFDYLHENRYYNNFWVFKSVDEAMGLSRLLKSEYVNKLTKCLIHEAMDKRLLPMIYCDDGNNYFIKANVLLNY